MSSSDVHPTTSPPRESPFTPPESRLKVYWDFARPFTLLPPMLGMISGAVTAIGAVAHREDVSFLTELLRPAGGLGGFRYAGLILLGALMAATLNAASNIINQLYDVENDRINKPNRPLPSGRVTERETWGLIVVLYAAALVMAWFLGPPGDHTTFWIVAIAAVMTYAYSAPPFRTKRWGLAANFTIAVPRGFLLKVAGWACVARVAGVEPWYIGSIFFFYLLGAATTKDYSDMEGDKAAGCITLPLKYGVKKSAWMVAPFFVLPWLMVPLGTLIHVESPFEAGTSIPILTGNALLLVGLGIALALYGCFVNYIVLRNPRALAEEGENHPSWTHMYRMMMLAQVGFALSYVF